MRSVRLLLLVSLCLPWLIAPAAAQQIRFIPDFSSGAGLLQLNGSQVVPYNNQVVLRMTEPNQQPPYPPSTSTYFKILQPVTQGFSTYFEFQMHGPTICCNPGDGFAFILQGSTATDPTQGAMGIGITAVGSEMGGLGYSGINNSLAIEFDIFGDPWDPNSNHIAIQSCGGGDPSIFNSPVHLPGVYTIGNNNDITSCLLSPGAINSTLPSLLGPMCNGESCSDGLVHTAVIEYNQPPGEQQGTLQVYLDPTLQPGTYTPLPGSVPVVSVPYNILYLPSNALGLTPVNLNALFVGFTASMADDATTTDILAWEFTSHSPSQITQVIPPGGTEDDFTFGDHQLGVTYPSSFQNPNGITQTVLATPVNQGTFYTNRLMGTQFADENCIIYSQTGGNCVVYSVTCHDANGNQITCPTETEPTIAICTQFETSELTAPVTDFLEAVPIGSNNWCSIWTFFMPGDPIVGGGGTGFGGGGADPIMGGGGPGSADLVATLSPTGRGPSCSGGGLQGLTKAMEKITNKEIKPKRSPDGGGFCPPIQ